jgi:hypothetical protein
MKSKKNLDPIQNYDLFKNSMIPNIPLSPKKEENKFNFRSTKYKQEIK